MLPKEYSSLQGKTVKTQGLRGPSHVKGAKTELAQRTELKPDYLHRWIHQGKSVSSKSGLSPVFQGCLRDASLHQDGNTSHDRNFCSIWCIFRHYVATRTQEKLQNPQSLCKTTELPTGFQETSSQNIKYPHSTCFPMSFYCLLPQHCVKLKAELHVHKHRL